MFDLSQDKHKAHWKHLLPTEQSIDNKLVRVDTVIHDGATHNESINRNNIDFRGFFL